MTGKESNKNSHQNTIDRDVENNCLWKADSNISMDNILGLRKSRIYFIDDNSPSILICIKFLSKSQTTT